MAATRTFLQGTADTANASTYTFAGQNLGTADAGRYIVCALHARGNVGDITITSITIAGVTATNAVTQANNTAGNSIVALFIAAVPTGTSGSVVVTLGTACLRASIQLYRVLGIDGVTPFDSGGSTANDPTFNLDIPASGLAIGAGNDASGGAGTCTWTGLTEDYDAIAEAQLINSSASDEFASTQTNLAITANFTATNNPCGVFASWSPSGGGGGGLSIPVAQHNYRRRRAA